MTVIDFNESVDKYADSVYRFILKQIRDSDKAKDIVQDTFEKVWLNTQNIDSNKAKSYIFTTAYHTLIDVVRREKKQDKIKEADLRTLKHEEQYSDLKELLNQAVDKLPEIQRSVVLLRDYEGYSYQEIGEILNLSESQVKVYIYRARLFLKNYIGTLQTVI